MACVLDQHSKSLWLVHQFCHQLGKVFDGFDSLLAIVQMPPGVPVATVAVNGARNAGILAVQVLAVGEARLQAELKQFKVRLREESRAKNKTLAP